MKNRQGLTIAALIIAIVGLSIGFAAFSNTLTISSSASVNPDPTSMNVVWSSSSSSAQTDAIVPTKNIIDVANFTATNATITGADYRTLNNVSAAFTAPGQTVTYNLHVFNAGSYTAYLTNLAFGSKACAAVPQQNASDTATGTLVTEACKGISISVSIGTETLTSSGSLNNQALAPNTSVPAQVVLTYASGSAFVDGPMSVTFDNITFTASTIAGSSQGGNEPTPVTPTYSVGDTYTGDFISTEAGVIAGYNGNGGSITIPDALPVVSISSSEFNMDKCLTLMDNETVWCTEAQKKYNGLEYDENFDSSHNTYDDIIPYFLDNVYTVTNATPQTITEIGVAAFMGKSITSVTFTNNITNQNILLVVTFFFIFFLFLILFLLVLS